MPLPSMLRAVVIGLVACWLLPDRAMAQSARPPVGVGFNTVLSSSEGLGIGLRVRTSAPINSDLSFAFGASITGFILQGRDDASYVFDPQVSVIVTIPQSDYSGTYLMGGIGAYLPFSDNGRSEAGPTIHGGAGWLQALNETTIFYEVNPALIVGAESVSIALPVRIGVIF